MESTRPDLGNSSLEFVEEKREPKREKTVVVSTVSATSGWFDEAPTLSPSITSSGGDSSVLANPLGALGVTVKRSSNKEGWPPKLGDSSNGISSSLGMKFIENVVVAVLVVVVVVIVVVVVVVAVVVVVVTVVFVVLATGLLVVMGPSLVVCAVEDVIRLKSKPKSEGTELVSFGSSESVVDLLVVVLISPTDVPMFGLIGIIKGIVIRAILGAVTVGKETLGGVTLPSSSAIPLISSFPLVSPETMERSKMFEDFGRSLKKLGNVTRVVVGSVLDASVVIIGSELIETAKGLGDCVG